MHCRRRLAAPAKFCQLSSRIKERLRFDSKADIPSHSDLLAKRLLSNLTDGAHFIFGMRHEKLVYLCGRSRNTNQITLYIRAAEGSSLLALLRCFDALSYDPHVEVSRHIGDGADNGAGFFFVR